MTPADTLFESGMPRPLADRLRPEAMEDVVGQDHLLKEQGAIGRMVAGKDLGSVILWGPPGSGKTTIARLLAEYTDHKFVMLSAIFSGVAEPIDQDSLIWIDDSKVAWGTPTDDRLQSR